MIDDKDKQKLNYLSTRNIFDQTVYLSADYQPAFSNIKVLFV